MQLLTLALIFSPILMGILIYAIDRDAFSRGLFVLQSGLTVLWALLLMRTLPALAAGEAVLFVAGAGVSGQASSSGWTGSVSCSP